VTDYARSEPEEALTKFFEPFMAGPPTSFFQIAEDVQEPGQGLLEAMKKFHEKHNMMSMSNELNERNPNNFNTMCHGDMWFNNMLFK
jgi:thiamine kinase-like enzyme